MAEKKTRNRIFNRSTRQWFEVPADTYRVYEHECAAFRKSMQRQGRCTCYFSKWWVCDMMCLYCKYRTDGTVALDALLGEAKDMTLLDFFPDESPAFEDVLAERDLFDRLIARLKEIDPDAEFLLASWTSDNRVSDRALAKALGVKQRTFADRMKRLRSELRKLLDE